MTEHQDPQPTADRIVDAAVTSTGAAGAVAAGAKEKGPSQATLLVQLALDGYNLGCTPDGEPYAIPKTGPPIVRLLRGGGRQSLRAELASAYYADTNSAASQSALADACAVIEGKAQRLDPVELHLRVAEHHGSLVLDLGDATGRCVVLTADGWQVVQTPPVRFRRTALTGVLPEPVRDGSFAVLWSALNVVEKYRPLVLAVLVSALLPGIPHPVVLLTGEQGTGKSTATARLAGVVDPSPAQLRKPPRDVEQWTTAAAGSWAVALDNLSSVPDWLSDALCRASTGDGDVRRRLYTDGDLHVIAFRRVPMINGIDVGALRGDLADRLVHLQLERIPADKRRRDEEMAAVWRAAHPAVLGAVLDLTVAVLGTLPTVALAELPRMADFARVIAAVDKVNDTDGLDTYLGLRDELAEDAATSDPVLVRIIEKITEVFTGTSADLLAAITPTSLDESGRSWKAPKDWPSSARGMTTVLARQAPTLRQLGWLVNKKDKAADARGKAIVWELKPPSESKPGRDDRPGADTVEPREGGNDAADAATRQIDLSSQVNQGATAAATAAATMPRAPRYAATLSPDQDHAATLAGRGTDAAHVAAPAAPAVTSANEDHAATAASAALNTNLLCPPTCRTCAEPLLLTLPGRAQCERCRFKGVA